MYSHSFLQFSASMFLSFIIFQVGSLPSIAPTDSAVPSFQCFLLQCHCIQADAFLTNPFTVLTPTASVYTLTRYSNSLFIPSRHLVTTLFARTHGSTAFTFDSIIFAT